MLENRIKKAAEFHNQGMNCSQSVVCAYCDIFGVDEKTAFRLSEGFGAGMGVQTICGALSGLIMLLGLKNSSGSCENITKGSTYKLAKEASEKFKAKVGSTVCAEIKGLNGKPILRTCQGCIEDACILFEEFVKEENIEKV